MLSAYTPPTSLTIQPGHTVKKAETTPETLKRVSAFIHFNRQKKYREAEKILTEQAQEKARREEAIKRQQQEDKQYIQNVTDEIAQLQQQKAELERRKVKEFTELQRRLTSSGSNSGLVRQDHHHYNHQQTHRNQHHHNTTQIHGGASHRNSGGIDHHNQIHALNHRTRSPANSGSSHGNVPTRLTNGTHRGATTAGSGGGVSYPGGATLHHHHHQSLPQLNNNAHSIHHSANMQQGPNHVSGGHHLDVGSAAIRKRARSRSPSPQLVKMYSPATRPTTPRGASMSPVAHAVASLNLPGVNHSASGRNHLYSDHNPTAPYGTPNNPALPHGFHNTTPQGSGAPRFTAGNPTALHGPSQGTVEQQLAAAVANSPFATRHHSGGVVGNPTAAAAAAVFHQHSSARQSLSAQYSLPNREHANVHTIGSAPPGSVSTHPQIKGRWPPGHGGM